MNSDESPDGPDTNGTGTLPVTEGRVPVRRFLTKRNVLRLLVLSFVLFLVVNCLLSV